MKLRKYIIGRLSLIKEKFRKDIRDPAVWANWGLYAFMAATIIVRCNLEG
jgi:hypothetical protein